MTDNIPTSRHCDEYGCFSRRQLLQQGATQPLRHVPVPDALLEDGGRRFFDRTYTRRDVLARGAGLMLAMGVASQLKPLQILEQAAAAESGQPILVSIYLQGGNDGLNTLVPRAGADRSRYDQLRTHLRLPPEQLLAIGGRDDLGWHPSAGGLQRLMDAGKLAAFTGVDFPQSSQSHFESAHHWRTGTTDALERYGWLGRYLDVVGTGNPLEGVAVMWGGDGSLVGRQAATSTVRKASDYGIWSPGVWNADRMGDAWASMGDAPRSSAYGRSVSAVRQAWATRQALRPLAAQEEAGNLPAPAVAYPADYSLAEELQSLGRLLSAGLGTRVATLIDGSDYDTHDQQAEAQAKNLKNLGDTLWAWQADLAARGLERRVVTVVWSEFGRRAHDNDSLGTDHGAGGLVLVVGARVQGGVRGDGWNLGRLDDGNLAVTTDFRDLYAGLLEGHLGIGARDVLPRYAGTPAPLLAA